MAPRKWERASSALTGSRSISESEPTSSALEAVRIVAVCNAVRNELSGNHNAENNIPGPWRLRLLGRGSRRYQEQGPGRVSEERTMQDGIIQKLTRSGRPAYFLLNAITGAMGDVLVRLY